MGTRTAVAKALLLSAAASCATTGDAEPPGDARDESTESWDGGCAADEIRCLGACVDLLSDPDNCGECGLPCRPANASGTCTAATCVVDCHDGWTNANGSPVDGCEYPCAPTASAESRSGTCSDGIDNDCDTRTDATDTDCSDCVPELCNRLDDDCDGLVDEDYDLDVDASNCGRCDAVCPDRPASTSFCVLGECDVLCEPGWANANGLLADGCEAGCTPDPSPDETACDGVDDDCDGLVDEDWTSTSTCGSGLCVRDSICRRGEVACRPRPPPSATDTTCDGLDDDCDGSTDEEGDCRCVVDADCDDANPCTDDICGPDLNCQYVAHADGSACPSGTCCARTCVDPATDPADCGSCGHACPDGLNADGACSGAACTLECRAGWVDADSLPGCEVPCPGGGTTESCNGADDDCDGSTDEGFPCRAGEAVACTTSCASSGIGTCSASCQVPTGDACPRPAETCNGTDDDCDTACDEAFGCCLGRTESCTTGSGAPGTTFCGPGCTPGTCTATGDPCNGVDDDGDTSCDEDFACCRGASESRGCTCGGTESRTCSGSCTWGGWSGCSGGTCTPGAVESRGCTCGGTESRTCSGSCSWGGWSGCSGGTCTPGAVESRGCACGGPESRTCSGSCTWGGWSGCAVPSHMGSGRNGDPCSEAPETWHCIWETFWGTWASQVCRSGSWLTYHLNPASCSACCPSYSSACE